MRESDMNQYSKEVRYSLLPKNRSLERLRWRIQESDLAVER
jgi:hypothetical protein